jgi:hypothetical protein
LGRPTEAGRREACSAVGANPRSAGRVRELRWWTDTLLARPMPFRPTPAVFPATRKACIDNMCQLGVYRNTVPPAQEWGQNGNNVGNACQRSYSAAANSFWIYVPFREDFATLLPSIRNVSSMPRGATQNPCPQGRGGFKSPLRYLLCHNGLHDRAVSRTCRPGPALVSRLRSHCYAPMVFLHPLYV